MLCRLFSSLCLRFAVCGLRVETGVIAFIITVGRGVGRGPGRVHVDRCGCPLPSRHVTGFPLPIHSRSGLLICHHNRIARSIFASLPRCLARNDLVMFGGAGIVRTHLRFHGRAKTLVRMFYLRPVRPGSCTLGFRRAQRTT